MSSQRELSSDVMAAFVHQVAIESLSEEQRRTMLSSLSEDLLLGKDVNLGKIAKQTAVRQLTDHPSHLCSQIDHMHFFKKNFYTRSWSNCEQLIGTCYCKEENVCKCVNCSAFNGNCCIISHYASKMDSQNRFMLTLFLCFFRRVSF